MKERFKFRVYDKEKGLMLYEDSEILRTEKVYEYEELWWANVAFPIKAISRFFEYNSEERFVLQQCTGLKDRSGKLIYEGDIIEWKKENHIVVFDERNATFGIKISDVETYLFNDIHTPTRWIEVIGNIYENKQLLEEQK